MYPIASQLVKSPLEGGNTLITLPLYHVPFIHNVPHPKVGQPYHSNVTPDNWDEETVETVPTNIDEGEEENLPQLPCRSPRLRINKSSNVPATCISQAALNTFMGNEYLEELSHMARRNLDPVNIEQVANSLVHPVTKETITKYRKLIADPPPC